MVDNNFDVEEMEELEIPEIPELLDKLFDFILEEGKDHMEQSGEVVPFTVLAVKENLYIETYPGDTADECFQAAQDSVAAAGGASAYAFCYDGYVETDEGEKDVLIAEGGLPGCDEAYAVGYVYEVDDQGTVTFDDDLAYIGEAPNFMAELKDPSEYSDSEIAAAFPSDEASDL